MAEVKIGAAMCRVGTGAMPSRTPRILLTQKRFVPGHQWSNWGAGNFLESVMDIFFGDLVTD